MVGEIALIGAVAIARWPAADLVFLAASTASASLSQIEGGVIIQSQASDIVARVQGAVSTSRFLGMAGGAALALVLALTVAWQILVLVLTVAGLALLGAAALGPRQRAEQVAQAGHTSPLSEIPE
jgi:uncharacterized membrane protein